MTKHKCGYEDCFNCPLKDCIVNGTYAEEPNISDYLDLSKQTEEETKNRKREYNRKKRKATA